MKCGILFNGKANFFKPYLEWILNFSNNEDICEISGIHTNDVEYFKRYFGDSTPLLVDDPSQILENSDIVYSLGYWKILKKPDIQKVPLGIVNFHHSHRLKYKGRHCATWAIRNNEEFHGSTMHFIDHRVDEGQIIDTDKFKIEHHHTAEDLFFLANETGLGLLKKNFRNTLDQAGLDFKEKELKCFTYKRKDLSHEISSTFFTDEINLLKQIRSLTFSNKPAPFVIIGNRKIYLKLEEYDTGLLTEKTDETRN